MKKLTALFLALALCLSLCTVTAFADSKTVGDILETAKGGFPTSEENAWVNASNPKQKCYIDNTELKFIDEETGNHREMELSGTVQNDYTWGFATFNMENNKLVSITIYNPIPKGDEYNGTYTAPTGDDDDDTPKWKKIATGVGIAAGITAATVGTIHTVKAVKHYKAEKAAAAEAAKLAEMPMVAMGSSGDAVTTLQTELNAQGYACGEADGVFGQNTLNAVIAFQTAKGLTADGVVGAQTWEALL